MEITTDANLSEEERIKESRKKGVPEKLIPKKLPKLLEQDKILILLFLNAE